MPAPADPPASRVGAVAGFGPRFLAFVVDGIIADLLAALINGGFHNSSRQSLTSYLVFLAIELFFVTFAGQTPGMRVVGIAVLRADQQGRAAFKWVLLRTALLATVVPALFNDSSGRAMHDRAAGTVMIHTR
ncbi:MAG TPA: RDD family protein [Mycobacteriales bacterium]|nr:RDD family protein [Mycobacteriales bacterium]